MRLIAALLVAASSQAAASSLSCYVEDSTRKHTCFDEKKVSRNGNIRSARLYTGGPAGVDATPYTIVVDCARGITTLQDKHGVNFAGALSGETKATRSLSRWVCETEKTEHNKLLKQFGM